MSTTPTDFSMMDVPPMVDTSTPADFSQSQPSDFGSNLFGLQDYTQVPYASNLNAPSLDSPLGVDPLTGMDMFPTDTLQNNLSSQPVDASMGLNAFDPGLLPYADPSNPTSGTIDPQFLSGLSTFSSPSSGDTLMTDGNLPLTTPDSLNLTPLAVPVNSPSLLGSSIWGRIFGTASTVIGAAASGTAGRPGNAQTPGLIKPAPKTAIANPISMTTSFLVIGLTAAALGAVLWSFSRKP